MQWNGSNRTTAYGSATLLTADIPAADIASAGTASVTVQNPGPGGGISSPLTFTITTENPVPVIVTISPKKKPPLSKAFKLTVTGYNFVPESTVEWKGFDRVTTFVSPEKLTAKITAKNVRRVGKYNVTVVNPEPGGGISNVMRFKVK